MVVVYVSICILYLFEAMVSVFKFITITGIYIGSLMVCDSI